MSHMRTTMQTQPDELRRLLADRGPAQAAAERIAGRRTWLVGIGTSWHAAHHGAWLLGEAGVDACALHAADVAPYERRFQAADALIVLSHTGQTATPPKRATRRARPAPPSSTSPAWARAATSRRSRPRPPTPTPRATPGR